MHYNETYLVNSCSDAEYSFYISLKRSEPFKMFDSNNSFVFYYSHSSKLTASYLVAAILGLRSNYSIDSTIPFVSCLVFYFYCNSEIKGFNMSCASFLVNAIAWKSEVSIVSN